MVQNPESRPRRQIGTRVRAGGPNQELGKAEPGPTPACYVALSKPPPQSDCSFLHLSNTVNSIVS